MVTQSTLFVAQMAALVWFILATSFVVSLDARRVVLAFGSYSQAQFGSPDGVVATVVPSDAFSALNFKVFATKYSGGVYADGSDLWMFGNNGLGTCGVTGVSFPTPVQTIRGAVAAVASSPIAEHVAVILQNGTLLTWGNNQQGQLGAQFGGNMLASPTQPVWTGAAVHDTITGVAVGAVGTIWYTNTNNAYSAGLNQNFHLNASLSADSVRIDPPAPMLTGPIDYGTAQSPFNYLIIGNATTAALLSDGTVVTLGSDQAGARGALSTTENVWANATILGPDTRISEKSICAGEGYFAGITVHDRVIVWGNNDNSRTSTPNLSTTQVRLLDLPFLTMNNTNKVIKVACGGKHMLLLTSSGRIWGWGLTASLSPLAIAVGPSAPPQELTDKLDGQSCYLATDIAAGYEHSLVVGSMARFKATPSLKPISRLTTEIVITGSCLNDSSATYSVTFSDPRLYCNSLMTTSAMITCNLGSPLTELSLNTVVYANVTITLNTPVSSNLISYTTDSFSVGIITPDPVVVSPLTYYPSTFNTYDVSLANFSTPDTLSIVILDQQLASKPCTMDWATMKCTVSNPVANGYFYAVMSFGGYTQPAVLIGMMVSEFWGVSIKGAIPNIQMPFSGALFGPGGDADMNFTIKADSGVLFHPEPEKNIIKIAVGDPSTFALNGATELITQVYSVSDSRDLILIGVREAARVFSSYAVMIAQARIGYAGSYSSGVVIGNLLFPAVPVAPPTDLPPVSPPTLAPVEAPVDSPVSAPVSAPIAVVVAAPEASNIAAGSISAGGIAAIIIVVIAVAGAVVGVVFYLRRKKNPQKSPWQDKPDDYANVELDNRPSFQPTGSVPSKNRAWKAGKAGGENAGDEVDAEKAKENELLIKSRTIPYEELTYTGELGRGSFGIVWKGRWRETDVAIKECTHVTTTEMEDFRREALLVLSIKPHPNIVQHLGIAFNKEKFSIIMEMMSGGSLDKLIYGSFDLEIADLLMIIKGIARGLHHLHSDKIVHRDIATRNILLTADKVPKITDFGFSRALAGADSGQTRTMLGPVRWMAPESLSSATYSTKSDVWMWACLCYEVFARVQPHNEEKDVLELASKIKKEGIHPKMPDYTPEWLCALLERCWSFKPEDRPSMKEIMSILHKQVNF